MNMLPDEVIVTSTPDKALVLTSHRVRLEAKASGTVNVTSIMLEEVSSCEIACKEARWILVVAVLLALVGVAFSFKELVVGLPVLIGAAFVLFAYLGTRRQSLSIASSGGARISLRTAADLDGWKRFIDQLEMAKDARQRGVPMRAAQAS